jgi:hypothetical protein
LGRQAVSYASLRKLKNNKEIKITGGNTLKAEIFDAEVSMYTSRG